MSYKRFIGKTFWVQGFNEPRKIKIEGVYLMGGLKKYPAFKCQVVGNYKGFLDGTRENFLCKNVVKNGRLPKVLHVLTA